jgi:FdrA protein
VIAARVQRGRWADSARLMAAARRAESEAGVERAACFMATPANLETARGLEIWDPAMDGAGPDDMVVAVRGDQPDAGLEAALAALEAGPGGGRGGVAATARAPRRLAGLEADLALISVPGEYAALEAHEALSAGMDVMLFSDGVPIEEEVALKRRAHELGRLVMGPGCGTAILDGVGLGFANVVASGPVGVVAAAGTGAQEVSVLVDRLGSGISRLYGTGGRDLHEEVGAITAIDAIDRLRRDPETRVILCVSKPPAAREGVRVEATLDGAALAAARLAGGTREPPPVPGVDWMVSGHVRGLFSGGTLCSEAAAILAERLDADVASNAPAGRARYLREGEPLRGHVCLDLGEEEYTHGRPHPMIDPEARAEILAAQAEEHDVGVILLDVVLGYSSHPDPAGALAPVLRRALRARPRLAVVAHVLGTDRDPQGLEAQERTLREVGVRLCPTNASAARLAAALVG